MKDCWNADGDARPTFTELVESTSGILRNARLSMKRKNRSSDASSANNNSSNHYHNSVKDDEVDNKYVIMQNMWINCVIQFTSVINN